MINREVRQAALAVRQGERPAPTAHIKPALYGLLARVMDPELLDEKLHSDRQPTSFYELDAMLFRSLGKSASEGLSALSQTEQDDVSGLIDRRINSARDLQRTISFSNVLSRLRQGSGTAAAAEVMTLRTIAREQAIGSVVTEEAIYASGRVPRALASIHLRSLPTAVRGYAKWSLSESGDGGDIFAPQEATWDATTGLRLAKVPDDLIPGRETPDIEPQIGCPATLVSGYLQRVHQIAATNALEAGLLKTS